MSEKKFTWIKKKKVTPHSQEVETSPTRMYIGLISTKILIKVTKLYESVYYIFCMCVFQFGDELWERLSSLAKCLIFSWAYDQIYSFLIHRMTHTQTDKLCLVLHMHHSQSFDESSPRFRQQPVTTTTMAMSTITDVRLCYSYDVYFYVTCFQKEDERSYDFNQPIASKHLSTHCIREVFICSAHENIYRLHPSHSWKCHAPYRYSIIFLILCLSFIYLFWSLAFCGNT